MFKDEERIFQHQLVDWEELYGLYEAVTGWELSMIQWGITADSSTSSLSPLEFAKACAVFQYVTNVDRFRVAHKQELNKQEQIKAFVKHFTPILYDALSKQSIKQRGLYSLHEELKALKELNRIEDDWGGDIGERRTLGAIEMERLFLKWAMEESERLLTC